MCKRLVGIVLVVLAVSQTCCLRWPSQIDAALEPIPSCPAIQFFDTSELPTAQLERLRADSEAGSISGYEAAIRSKLLAGNFDDLERVVAGLRLTKERFPGGAWKLERFYIGVAYPSDADESTERGWQKHLDHLRIWLASRPSSLAAHIALGRAMLQYGWHARGSGYANTVTEEGGRLFGERVGDAEKIISDVGDERLSDPGWHSVMLEIGVSLGWSKTDFDQIFEEGISVEPLYQYLYYQKARYLMPRWYGQVFDVERFMQQSLHRWGGQEGLALYYLIGEYLFPYYPYRTIVTASKICWETMKKGYFALEALYGTELTRMNWMAKLCGIAGEKQLCSWFFVRIGDRWIPGVWPQGKPDFDGYRSWANS